MKEKVKIPVAEPDLGPEEVENVLTALREGWISSKGSFINQFEENFASYIGTSYGVATSNGTAALHLALAALGFGKDDKIITNNLTFVSPVNSILYVGATPVLVDSTAEYWGLDTSKIEERIDKHTRAILVVHLYGHPCDMDSIMKLSRKYDLKVIEDCAEAHGAIYKGKRVGNFGDISCFSFYGNKVITTGEGGMCLTNDEEIYDKIKIFRDHGMTEARRYWHDVIGFNYRMTNLQAAIGVAQLDKIDKFINIRRKNASIYKSELLNLSGITFQPEMSWATSIYWLYSILINEEVLGINRIAFSNRLKNLGIDTRNFFYPVNIMPPYRKFGEAHSFPVSERLSNSGINLPSSTKLEKDDIIYVTDSIKEILEM